MVSPSTMHFPVHFTRPQIAPEPPALVRHVAREEVRWNCAERHVFKAPPLDVHPPVADVAALAAERRRDLYAA